MNNYFFRLRGVMVTDCFPFLAVPFFTAIFNLAIRFLASTNCLWVKATSDPFPPSITTKALFLCLISPVFLRPINNYYVLRYKTLYLNFIRKRRGLTE